MSNLKTKMNSLYLLIQILAGQQDVLDQLQDLAGDWYQIMVTKLLYTNPMVKAVDLQYHAKVSLRSVGLSQSSVPSSLFPLV